MQTQCLVEGRDEAVVDVRVRFLQLQARSVEEVAADGAFRPVERLELDGRILVTWDEACERDVTLASLCVADLLGGERVVPLEIPGGEEPELLRDAAGVVKGRIVRRRWPVSGCLRLRAARFGDGTIAAVNLSRPIAGRLSTSLQGKLFHQTRSTYISRDVPSAGMTFVYVTPGLHVDMPGAVTVYGLLQMLGHRYVNDMQLAPRVAVLAGLSKTF